jgi:hypothetical protein
MTDELLPVGLMFSHGGFLTETFFTPEIAQTETDVDEPGRTLWLINLVPIRFVAVTDVIDRAFQLQRTETVHKPGNIIRLRWDRRYILEPDVPGVLGVLIRAVDLIPGDGISDIVPLDVHRGDPLLGAVHGNHAEMPSLLSRLEALTHT